MWNDCSIKIFLTCFSWDLLTWWSKYLLESVCELNLKRSERLRFLQKPYLLYETFVFPTASDSVVFKILFLSLTQITYVQRNLFLVKYSYLLEHFLTTAWVKTVKWCFCLQWSILFRQVLALLLEFVYLCLCVLFTPWGCLVSVSPSVATEIWHRNPQHCPYFLDEYEFFSALCEVRCLMLSYINQQQSTEMNAHCTGTHTRCSC